MQMNQIGQLGTVAVVPMSTYQTILSKIYQWLNLDTGQPSVWPHANLPDAPARR